jgi:hypothetical protein
MLQFIANKRGEIYIYGAMVMAASAVDVVNEILQCKKQWSWKMQFLSLYLMYI